MSEIVTQDSVTSIATGHQIAVCQPWAESDRGWISPDSFSLHGNLRDAWVFIRDAYKVREHAATTPSSYIRVEGAPYPVVVTQRLFKQIEDTRPPAEPESNGLYGGPSSLVRKVLLAKQYPADCRTEAGNFPPAFADDETAKSWETLFHMYSFDGQRATSDFFSKVFKSLATPLDQDSL